MRDVRRESVDSEVVKEEFNKIDKNEPVMVKKIRDLMILSKSCSKP